MSNSQEYLQSLYILASNLVPRSKAAALNVGNELLVPSTPYVNAAGSYDPDPSMAYSSLMSQQRAAMNASLIQDGSLQGFNLRDYQSILNEANPIVAGAMNPPLLGTVSGRSKFASMDEDDYVEMLSETGMFDDVDIYPDPETLDFIDAYAREKAASISEAQVVDMYESGILSELDADDYAEILLSDEDDEYEY